MSKKRLEVRVSGRVQGVSFRYYTQRKAQEVGAVGWVRNESDGDVQIVAEGEQSALEELLEFVREGPSFARVEHCAAEWGEWTGTFRRFQVTH